MQSPIQNNSGDIVGDFSGEYAPKTNLDRTRKIHYDKRIRRCGGTGRRKGLKIPRWQQRTGSIPVSGTSKKDILTDVLFAVFVSAGPGIVFHAVRRGNIVRRKMPTSFCGLPQTSFLCGHKTRLP